MRMTPTVILVGILALLAAITLTVVYWPYAKRNMTPSDIFRDRTAEEAAGRKIYLQNGCVYCHSQSIRGIDWGHGADRIAQSGDYIADEPIAWDRSAPGWICPRKAVSTRTIGTLPILSIPRYTRPSSIMPPFEWLGMERINTLTRISRAWAQKCGPPHGAAAVLESRIH